MKTLSSMTLLLSALSLNTQAAEPPSLEKMWENQKRQQQQIEALTKENKQLADQLEVSMQALEQTDSKQGHGQAGMSAPSIGGYGELHYNNIEDKDDEIDFHRFVLFFGYEFTDRIRFFSELELEHSIAGEGKDGEIELEQAYIEMDISDKHATKAGLFLMPVGIINETHEPDTFYGVERNPIEKNIIPATWWEGGIALGGQLGGGLSYDVALTSGLQTPTTGSNAFKIRNGRQKVSEAKANDGALTGRIKYTGVAGLELAATVQHQTDLTQGQGAAGTETSANMIEAHAVYQQGPFGLRALYAQWDLDSAAASALGRDEQSGWYIEPSYKINPQWGVFARYNVWDNNAGDVADTEIKQTDVGINYWPHENVVFKFDVQRQSGAVDDDGFNLGVGYQF
jgi:hypothetical protein